MSLEKPGRISRTPTPSATTDFDLAAIAALPKGPMPIFCDEDDEPATITASGRTVGRYARQCIGTLNYCC